MNSLQEHSQRLSRYRYFIRSRCACLMLARALPPHLAAGRPIGKELLSKENRASCHL